MFRKFFRNYFAALEYCFPVIAIIAFIGIFVEYPVQWIGVTLSIAIPLILIPILYMLAQALLGRKKDII